jgi:hypothetical protein
MLLSAASVPRARRRSPASPRVLLRKLCSGGEQEPVASSRTSSCCGSGGGVQREAWRQKVSASADASLGPHGLLLAAAVLHQTSDSIKQRWPQHTATCSAVLV